MSLACPRSVDLWRYTPHRNNAAGDLPSSQLLLVVEELEVFQVRELGEHVNTRPFMRAITLTYAVLSVHLLGEQIVNVFIGIAFAPRVHGRVHVLFIRGVNTGTRIVMPFFLTFARRVHVFTVFRGVRGIGISFLPPAPDLGWSGQALHHLAALPPGRICTLDQGQPVLALLHELRAHHEERLVVRDRTQGDPTGLGDLPLTEAVPF